MVEIARCGPKTMIGDHWNAWNALCADASVAVSELLPTLGSSTTNDVPIDPVTRGSETRVS